MPTDSYIIESQWRNRIALFLFTTTLLLALLDKNVQEFRVLFVYCAMAVLGILDIPSRQGQADWRAIRQRLFFVLASLIVTLAVAEIARDIVDRDDVKRRAAFYALFEFHGLEVLSLSLWLFAPLGIRWMKTIRCACHGKPHPGVQSIMIHSGLVMLFAQWCFVTAFSSGRPDRGFRYFAFEIGAYAAFYLFWLRHATQEARLQRAMKTIALLLFLATVLFGIGAAGTYTVGNDKIREAMTREAVNEPPMIKVHPTDTGSVWHLNAPFGHHNRMGYFSALAFLVLACGAMCARRTGVKILLGSVALLSLLNLALTLNRGATLALIVAVAIVALIVLGRRSIWLVPATMCLFVFLGNPQKERLFTIFMPDTYTSKRSTANIRFQHWSIAASLIRENPVVGVGYGWKHYAKIHQQRGWEMGIDLGLDHAHNIWVQITGESGFPASALFLAWCFARWFMLLQLLKKKKLLNATQRRMLFLWIGVETIIQVYSLANFPLRRSLGLLTWGLWSLMTVDLLELLSRTDGIEPIQGKTQP